MKSVMTKDFSRIPQVDINRSKFNRSHGLKTAFNAGYLVPIEVQEVYPGDEVDYNSRALIRLAPCVTVPMDNVFLDMQAFFVPSRLLWTNWAKMLGERVNPNDSIDFLVPVINSGEEGFAEESLADYFGIPTKVPNLDVNCLPFRAYQKIWDDWYRDENLQNSMIQSSDDLGDTGGEVEWTKLQRRGKRHDYFTSALPWPQREEGVNLPLGTFAPVVGNGNVLGMTANGTDYYRLANNPTLVAAEDLGGDLSIGVTTPTTTTNRVNHSGLGVVTDPDKSGLVADLSEATAATINSLRVAFQTQVFLEQSARSGTRLVEIIRGFFGVVCPDARLQRSEYLGGSSDMISFNPVAQTSATIEGVETAQGNLTSNPKGFGSLRFKKAFTEHGFIIILANVRADLNYQQGLDRMWSRRSRFDFMWPVFSRLGEQEVKNKEIFAQGKDVVDENGNIIDDLPFGYQERYAELRYAPSIITGKMRSNASQSLDVWHLAQQFEELPVLNANFIEDNPPLDRIIAVTDEPEVLMDCYHECFWTRPLPTYGIPAGLPSHF